MLETAVMRRVISLVVMVATMALAVPAGSAREAGASVASVPLQVRTGLVLSGGGAKGAWEAGVAAALVEAGLPVALVAGSSAGALNAAMIAAGRADRLDGLWRGVDRGKVY